MKPEDSGASGRKDPGLGGLLTGAQIKDRGLIVDLDEPNLYDSSYDLRLGEEYRGTDGKFHSLTPQDPELIIPAYGVVVVSTLEVIKTDEYVAGRFDLKIRHALSGLVLQVGTQVEPQYEGRLFGLVFNLSDRPVHLYYSEPTFTVEFHKLAGAVEKRERPKETAVLSLRQFLVRRGREAPVLSALKGIEEVRDQVKSLAEEATRALKQTAQQIDSGFKKIEKDVEKQVTQKAEEVRAVHTQWVINKWVVGVSVCLFVLGVFMTAILPYLMNKSTYDRDDRLVRELARSRVQSSDASSQSIEQLDEEVVRLRREIATLRMILVNLATSAENGRGSGGEPAVRRPEARSDAVTSKKKEPEKVLPSTRPTNVEPEQPE